MSGDTSKEHAGEPPSAQGEVFLRGEGDRWFERNVTSKVASIGANAEMDFLTEVLTPFRESINSILEIGCADGMKLRHLCEALHASGAGIDPSAQAIQFGSTQSCSEPISLSVGLAHELPYEDSSFDMVHFGFCLYLIDRDRVEPALNEAHRVLRPGGFMVITDFDPAIAHSRPYHHCAGVLSHKMDYSAALCHPGYYHLAYKHSYSHRYPFFDSDSNERVAVSVLFKELTNIGNTPITVR